MKTAHPSPHPIVSADAWREARQLLLTQEKELTRLHDQLSQQRRALPWTKVEKVYRFAGPDGSVTLADLFENRSQLVVYHFMFAPDWEEGCKGCSFWADNFDGVLIHLRHRDVTFVAISRAPWEKLEAFRKRMGWHFKWLSSAPSDFNYDYHVSFAPEAGEVEYNYTNRKTEMSDLPGVSVFWKDEDGNIFHTYSAYARGLDMLNAGYQYLDLVPKGRDEEEDDSDWLRHHDRYET